MRCGADMSVPIFKHCQQDGSARLLAPYGSLFGMAIGGAHTQTEPGQGSGPGVRRPPSVSHGVACTVSASVHMPLSIVQPNQVITHDRLESLCRHCDHLSIWQPRSERNRAYEGGRGHVGHLSGLIIMLLFTHFIMKAERGGNNHSGCR